MGNRFFKTCKKRSCILGILLIIWMLAMNILSGSYSGICVAKFAKRNMPNLPKNLEALLKMSKTKDEIPLISSSKVDLGNVKIPVSYIRHQVISQALYQGLPDTRLTEFYTNTYNRLLDRVKFKMDELKHFFDITYGRPILLSKRNYSTEGNVNPSIVKFKLNNGIIAFLDKAIDRERYEIISKISNLYEVFEDRHYYNGEIAFEKGGLVLWNDHKFLGDFFHNHLAKFESMGLFDFWNIQKRIKELSVIRLQKRWIYELNMFTKSESLKINEKILNFTKLKEIFKLLLLALSFISIAFLIENLCNLIISGKISISNLYYWLKIFCFLIYYKILNKSRKLKCNNR